MPASSEPITNETWRARRCCGGSPTSTSLSRIYLGVADGMFTGACTCSLLRVWSEAVISSTGTPVSAQ